MTGRKAPLPLVVLVSGHGSNLQAILDRVAAGTLPVDVRAVLSDRPEAEALNRAQAADIRTESVTPAEFPDKAAYDEALIHAVDRHSPELVVLAGFMRILGPGFVRRHLGRMLNIHPSLLPKYRGLHTHRRALEAGDKIHGCSVHFVTEELDGGPVIAQAEVPVLPGDDEAALRSRVQGREHGLYPEVIDWYARGRLRLDGQRPVFDGVALTMPKIFPWKAQDFP
jgi:phosphoribosylglycinamide formyltransferase-1